MWSLNDHWLVPLATWLWDLNKWDISTLLALSLKFWGLHPGLFINKRTTSPWKKASLDVYKFTPLCRTRFGQYQMALG